MIIWPMSPWWWCDDAEICPASHYLTKCFLLSSSIIIIIIIIIIISSSSSSKYIDSSITDPNGTQTIAVPLYLLAGLWG